MLVGSSYSIKDFVETVLLYTQIIKVVLNCWCYTEKVYKMLLIQET